MSVKDKLLDKSNVFWTGLFYLLDEEKAEPLRAKEKVGVSLDEQYSLCMSRNRIWFVDASENHSRTHCMQTRKEENFPYTKLLDWYIKKTVPEPE